MKHQCKVTVLDTKVFPELQEKYLANPKSGPCFCYHPGDEFLFRRDDEHDDFWHMGINTLVKTSGNADETADTRRCRSAPRHGMRSADISTPLCRVVPL